MLIFRCTECKGAVVGDDNEDPDLICNRLEEHIAKCPMAAVYL
jgi:hypothetical protein